MVLGGTWMEGWDGRMVLLGREWRGGVGRYKVDGGEGEGGKR